MRSGACCLPDHIRTSSLTIRPFSLHLRYNDDLTLEDAIHTALLTLKESFEGEMTEKTIEVGILTVPKPGENDIGPGGDRSKGAFRKLSEREVKDYLDL